MSIHRYDMTATTIGNPQAEADVRVIMDLWSQVSGKKSPLDIETCRTFMDDLDYHIARADRSAQIVGAVSVYHSGPGRAKLESLAVHPEHQRNGYGMQLAEVAIENAFDKKAQLILAHATPASQRIFERLGFEDYEFNPDSGNMTMMLERSAR